MTHIDDGIPAGLESALEGAAEKMPSDARRGVRRHVVGAVRRDASHRPARRVGTFALATALAVALMSGVAVASEAALPGDALYPVKIAMEQVEIGVLPESGYRDSVAARHAERRAEELEALVMRGAEGAALELAFGALERATARMRLLEGEGGIEARLRKFEVDRERALRLTIDRTSGPLKERAERALGVGEPLGDGPTGPGEGTGTQPGEGPAGPGDGSGDAPGPQGDSGDQPGPGPGTPQDETSPPTDDTGSNQDSSPGPGGSDGSTQDQPKSGQDGDGGQGS
jgi:hypothetical protein